jgi:hypothetical protein
LEAFQPSIEAADPFLKPFRSLFKLQIKTNLGGRPNATLSYLDKMPGGPFTSGCGCNASNLLLLKVYKMLGLVRSVPYIAVIAWSTFS